MIECLCIDDTNRPNEIPMSNWIQKGFKYHIIHVYFNELSQCNGAELAEVKIPANSRPYTAYKLSRFAFKEEDLERLKELIKNCNELDNFDVNKFVEESQLELIDK